MSNQTFGPYFGSAVARALSDFFAPVLWLLRRSVRNITARSVGTREYATEERRERAQQPSETSEMRTSDEVRTERIEIRRDDYVDTWQALDLQSSQSMQGESSVGRWPIFTRSDSERIAALRTDANIERSRNELAKFFLQRAERPVMQYYTTVHGLVNEDAEELFENVVLRAINANVGPKDPNVLFYTLMRSELSDYRRSKQRTLLSNDDYDVELMRFGMQESESADEYERSEVVADCVRAALAKFAAHRPDSVRFVRWIGEGLSAREIALELRQASASTDKSLEPSAQELAATRQRIAYVRTLFREYVAEC